MELNGQFAVVRTNELAEHADMKFKKFISQAGPAFAEAERLCRKENDKFFVVQVVGYVQPKYIEPPVEIVKLNEPKDS